MHDAICRMLDDADEARKHQIVAALLPVLKPCTTEDMNEAMLEIFAILGYTEYRQPTPLDKSGLKSSINRLQVGTLSSWTSVLVTRGLNLEEEACQTLIGRSPYNERFFLVVEDNAGIRRVRYAHLPQSFAVAERTAITTRNRSFIIDSTPAMDLGLGNPVILLDEHRKAQPARQAA